MSSAHNIGGYHKANSRSTVLHAAPQQSSQANTSGGASLEELLKYIDKEGWMHTPTEGIYSDRQLGKPQRKQQRDGQCAVADKSAGRNGYDEVWRAIQSVHGQSIDSSLASSLLESLLFREQHHDASALADSQWATNCNRVDTAPAVPRSALGGMSPEYHAATQGFHVSPSSCASVKSELEYFEHPCGGTQLDEQHVRVAPGPLQLHTSSNRHCQYYAAESDCRRPYGPSGSQPQGYNCNYPQAEKGTVAAAHQVQLGNQAGRLTPTSHSSQLQHHPQQWVGHKDLPACNARQDGQYSMSMQHINLQVKNEGPLRTHEKVRSAAVVAATAARAARKKKRREPEVADDRVHGVQKRMVKNRESAARSRARRQQYTCELQEEVTKLKEENVQLKAQLILDSRAVLDDGYRLHTARPIRRTRTSLY